MVDDAGNEWQRISFNYRNNTNAPIVVPGAKIKLTNEGADERSNGDTFFGFYAPQLTQTGIPQSMQRSWEEISSVKQYPTCIVLPSGLFPPKHQSFGMEMTIKSDVPIPFKANKVYFFTPYYEPNSTWGFSGYIEGVIDNLGKINIEFGDKLLTSENVDITETVNVRVDFDGTTAKLFVNDALQAQDTPNQIGDDIYEFCLGGWQSMYDTGEYKSTAFKGTISNFKFY